MTVNSLTWTVVVNPVPFALYPLQYVLPRIHCLQDDNQLSFPLGSDFQYLSLNRLLKHFRAFLVDQYSYTDSSCDAFVPARMDLAYMVAVVNSYVGRMLQHQP